MPRPASSLAKQLQSLPLFTGLSEAQRTAVFHRSERLVVLAGAGAGKTRVLVARMAWLLWGDPKIPFEQILAITFTRKACGEMRERLKALQVALGIDGRLPAIDTFHATALKILRDGATRRLEIIEDPLPLFQAFLKGDPQLQRLGVNGSQLLDDMKKGRSEHLAQGRLLQLQERFRAYKMQKGQVVMDDLVPLALERLKDERVQERWAGRLSYLLVDEFQDVNDAQMGLFEALCEGEAAYSIFGDDDQAIYRFRGSNPECLRRLARAKGVDVCFLPINYRCAPPILALAEAVISQDDKRLTKAITSGRDGGILPRCLVNGDPAVGVVNECLRQFKRGRKAEDLCVLVRDHFSAGAVERALSRAKLPEGMGAIRIQTYHSSKGLEFPVVLMPFMDEGRFPSQKRVRREVKQLDERKRNLRPIIQAHKILKRRRRRAIADLYRIIKIAHRPPTEVLTPVDGLGQIWINLAQGFEKWWGIWWYRDLERSLTAREKTVRAIQRTLDAQRPRLEQAKAFEEARDALADDGAETLREERRLCYVAITRARDEIVFITRGAEAVSSFINGVPRSLLRWEKDKAQTP